MQIFSSIPLIVYGYYLERTLKPIPVNIPPQRCIIYGVGSSFTVGQSIGSRTVIIDSIGNSFTVTNEELDVNFERI